MQIASRQTIVHNANGNEQVNKGKSWTFAFQTRRAHLTTTLSDGEHSEFTFKSINSCTYNKARVVYVNFGFGDACTVSPSNHFEIQAVGDI